MLFWWVRFSTVWTKVANNVSLLGTGSWFTTEGASLPLGITVEDVIAGRRTRRGWLEGVFRGDFFSRVPTDDAN